MHTQFHVLSPDKPERQTGKKHILSNMNGCHKGSNSVSYTSTGRCKAIHARFINFHVVKYGPDLELYPLQVSDDEFKMMKKHLDRLELFKDLLKPLDGWLDSGKILFTRSRFLVLCYTIIEKNNRGFEFIISWLTEFP